MKKLFIGVVIVAVFTPLTSLAVPQVNVRSPSFVVDQASPGPVLIIETQVHTARIQPPDTDADGVENSIDNCPSIKNGNCSTPANCDINGDGMVTEEEIGASGQMDSDNDGVGDACDDSDGDGVVDYIDVCPTESNPVRGDGTQDANACIDDDGDGFFADEDNCPNRSNPTQADRDDDGIGDACDNCWRVANADQADDDEDGFGNACTMDADGDGILDRADNCPQIANSDQIDSDHDYKGDACDVETVSNNDPPGPEPLPQASGDGGCSVVAAGAVDSGAALAFAFVFGTLLLICRGRRR